MVWYYLQLQAFTGGLGAYPQQDNGGLLYKTLYLVKNLIDSYFFLKTTYVKFLMSCTHSGIQTPKSPNLLRPGLQPSLWDLALSRQGRDGIEHFSGLQHSLRQSVQTFLSVPAGKYFPFCKQCSPVTMEAVMANMQGNHGQQVRA